MEDGSLFRRMKQIFHGEEDEKNTHGEEAAELIRNIFRYMDKDAKDIMTHRKNIVGIDGETVLEDAFAFMMEEKYTRFPVYKEDIDEITGILHLRDAMTCYLDAKLRKKPVCSLVDYIRPVTFIPETKSIDRLFRQMQAEKNHIAVVLDEYGQTSGLVAMEDILEEIVGNIMDEYDEEEELVIKQSDGVWIADGFAGLEGLEDLLEVSFEQEEVETLNGFLIAQLDRIPAEGECFVVEHGGYRFTVLSVDNNTIRSVKIEKCMQE